MEARAFDWRIDTWHSRTERTSVVDPGDIRVGVSVVVPPFGGTGRVSVSRGPSGVERAPIGGPVGVGAGQGTQSDGDIAAQVDDRHYG